MYYLILFYYFPAFYAVLLEFHFIELIVAVKRLGSLYGERYPLAYALDRLEVYPYLFDNTLVSSCRISHECGTPRFWAYYGR